VQRSASYGEDAVLKRLQPTTAQGSQGAEGGGRRAQGEDRKPGRGANHDPGSGAELTPPQIDAQYIPGFNWARQPQVRLTGDFLDHKLWIAVSADNPATTFGGTVPSSVTATAPAGSGFDSSNSLSLNSVPDFAGEVAYDGDIDGHALHVKAFGLLRSFKAHINDDGNAHGYGGGVVLQVVPKVLDVQFSGMGGKRIGRYGSPSSLT
jgi:hypothetical protein